MAYEDLTTFTEVSGAKWSQTTTRNTFTRVYNTDVSYLYKDYSVNHFGDFEHDFDFKVTFNDAWGMIGLWAITNIPNPLEDLTEGLSIRCYRQSSLVNIQLKDAFTGATDQWLNQGGTYTTYYIKISRTDSTAICKIYPTAQDRIDDTNIIDTLSIVCQSTAYRYLLAGLACNSSFYSYDENSGYVENFDLNEGISVSKDILANIKGEVSVSKDVTASLADTISVSKDVSFSLSHAFDILSNLFGTTAVSKDVLSVLQKEFSVSKDISFYIVNRIFGSEDILTNLKGTVSSSEDIAARLALVISVPEDISASLAITQSVTKDISTNLKDTISDTYNVGAILAKEDIYDFDSDIRWKLEQKKDIGFALTLPTPEILPAGLDEVKVYVNEVLLSDIDIRTAQWTWTMNDRPGSCSFLLARKFDDFNNKLTGDASSLAVDQVIQIKFNGILKFYGYIVNIDVSANRETVIVRGLDRKYKVDKELCSEDYGRHSESGYDRTGAMLTNILDDLVTKEHISSYSGIPTGIVPELREQDGVPYARLITELLEQSGNYKWNITPDGVLKIYKQGDGVLSEIPYQESSRQIALYDVIDCRFTVNDISNMITVAEVVMGTESVETYDSYNRIFLHNATLYPAWSSAQESAAKTELELNSNLMLRGVLIGDPNRIQNELMDVYRRYSIPSWEEGSFIDSSVKPYIQRDAYDVEVEGLYVRKYKHTRSSSWRSYGGDWSIEDGYVRFSYPQVICSQTEYDMINDAIVNTYYTKAFNPKLTMAFYKKESKEIATYPTIFDVTFIGSGGVGYKRRLVFSNLGVAQAVNWNEYIDGALVWHHKPGYNDTVYATDRANLFLSRVNDPITQGNFSLTLDAQDYYGVDLGKKINIIKTEDSTIYQGNNSFPIDVEEVKFDAGNYLCTVSGRNRRIYVCSQDMPERD